MKAFLDWISAHSVAALLAAVSVCAILYVAVKRKELLHK